MANNFLTSLFSKQKKLFYSGKTLDVKYRKAQLKKLLLALRQHQKEILVALNKDLNKSLEEGYITEYMIVLNELKYMINNINKLSKPISAKKSMTTIFSKSKIYKRPRGVVLVCSPWNYPFQLSMIPLVESIATGNTTMMYLSSQSKNVNEVIHKILSKCFSPEYVCTFSSDKVPYDALFQVHYDFLFFTGSNRVGKILAKQCADMMIPAVYELGGKCPCIIDSKSNLVVAAKRIARGKWFNAGQTCVAPDHVYVPNSVYDKFVEFLVKYTKQFFEEEFNKKQFPKIINKLHYDRLTKLLEKQKVLYGGKKYEAEMIISPTIIEVNKNNKIMDEEIFGPILPLIKYDNLKNIIEYQNSHDEPLAMYVFSNNKKNIKMLEQRILSGACCVNDCIMHITNHHLPFGGVGQSGNGHYHGEYGFNTFSHLKSVVDSSSKLDTRLFYPPWTKTKFAIIKKIFK